MPRRYWLMKCEPAAYTIDDLARDGETSWEGVRNYQARNLMRDEMRVGDGVLYYASNADPSGVTGLAKIARRAYPDHFAWKTGHKYFDALDGGYIDINGDLAFQRLSRRGAPSAMLKTKASPFTHLVCGKAFGDASKNRFAKGRRKLFARFRKRITSFSPIAAKTPTEKGRVLPPNEVGGVDVVHLEFLWPWSFCLLRRSVCRSQGSAGRGGKLAQVSVASFPDASKATP